MGGSELAYQLLEQAQPASGLWANESEVTVAAGDVLHAVDETGRHLLIPVAHPDDIPQDRSGAAVHLRARDVGTGRAGTRTYLDVVCLQRPLARVFATFVDDLLRELAQHPEHAERVTVEVVRRWRQLFRRRGPGGLSEERVVGLIGELQLLLDLAQRNPEEALQAWRGWAGEVWDFVRSGTALELKTTTRPEGRRFWVHGIHQLDTADGTDLAVQFRRYVRDPSEGAGIADLVAELSAAGVDDIELRRRLTHIGWTADGDTEARYSLVEVCAWRVDDDFPRIVTDSLVAGVPEGVDDLRYLVELAAPPPSPLTAPEVTDILEELVGGA